MGRYRPTPINRLMTELSWCLPNAKQFRDGGQRDENVLTVHVLHALDLLPRLFLGAVLKSAFDGIGAEFDSSDLECAEITVLPNDPFLRLGSGQAKKYPRVQPDAIIECGNKLIWVEAKAQGGSFQERQLAREYYCVTKSSAGRLPLLLLITNEPSPFRVAKLGTLEASEAVRLRLADVYERHGEHPEALPELMASIGSRIGWISWPLITDVIQGEMNRYRDLPDPVAASIRRLATTAVEAVKWHCDVDCWDSQAGPEQNGGETKIA